VLHKNFARQDGFHFDDADGDAGLADRTKFTAVK
jgi:hypothetical protein